jgi:Carbon dioxide concentrating mechanism/carboxysome shell protein
VIIGKVVGTVIATRKNSNLVGNKFLIVQPIDEYGFDSKNRVVAIDNVGAGNGDLVLVAIGSAARIGCNMDNAPVDAAIVGIVDDAKDVIISQKAY